MARVKKSLEDQIRDLKAYIADLEKTIAEHDRSRESNLNLINIQRNHIEHHHKHIQKLTDENHVLKAALKEIL